MKKNKELSLPERVQLFLASNTFFYSILGFSVLSAVWVAISSAYPMAFDEDFHLGMIRLYAEHWGPFSLTQTEDANKFGSVVTDPSYLYHYLMSFPYRILDGLGASETTTVISLRLINVALFGWAVWLYRKVLLRAQVSFGITNMVLALFVLVPVVPLLAGQINYDNALLVITAGALLLAITVQKGLRRSELPVRPLLYLLMLLLFGIVVKYAFLPIAAGIVLYLAFELWRTKNVKTLLAKSWGNVQALSTASKVIISIGFIILFVLAGQRYGTNLVKYHDPVPDCGAVLTVEQCMPYGPWGRDYAWSQTAHERETENAIVYTVKDWIPGMWRRLFFTIAGPTVGYDTQKPLPIPSITAIVLTVGGVILLCFYGRQIFKEYPLFWLFVVPSALYLIAVWQQVFKIYNYTAWPMAINGRYLIPLLPLLCAVLVVAYVKFLRARKLSKYNGVLAVIIILFFLQGGGVATYIVRSQDKWFMPNSWMQDVNSGLRTGLKPVLYEGSGWFSYRGGP